MRDKNVTWLKRDNPCALPATCFSVLLTSGSLAPRGQLSTSYHAQHTHPPCSPFQHRLALGPNLPQPALLATKHMEFYLRGLRARCPRSGFFMGGANTLGKATGIHRHNLQTRARSMGRDHRSTHSTRSAGQSALSQFPPRRRTLVFPSAHAGRSRRVPPRRWTECRTSCADPTGPTNRSRT